MDQLANQNKKVLVTFKTKDKVTVKIHGKPNFDMWAKKMIDLIHQLVKRESMSFSFFYCLYRDTIYLTEEKVA